MLNYCPYVHDFGYYFEKVQLLTYSHPGQTCQGLYSRTVCDSLDLDEYKTERDAVQDGASYWMLYSNIALAVPTVISGIYIGTWSDLFGRKVPLLLPPLGQILAALVYMAMSAYEAVPVGFNVLANLLAGEQSITGCRALLMGAGSMFFFLNVINHPRFCIVFHNCFAKF